MADIFISYASEDRSRVELLVKALRDQGWSIFWDLTIPVGKTWRQFITEELDAANCAVVIWSSTSISSEWVEEEADEAKRRRIMVPAMIDKVQPPLGFRATQAARLINWAGNSNHPEFEKLLKGIEALLGPSPLKVKEAEEKRAEEEHRLKEAERKRKEAKKEPGRKAIEQLKQQKKPTRRDVPKTYTNSIGMEFILIPSGSFTMGSSTGDKNEKPPHEVKISQCFYLQTTQVTQAQWEIVMGDNPSGFKDCGANCPVERVSWDRVQKFIQKLNAKEGTDKHRLPTEAEWEYACRAGTATNFSFGDDVGILDEYAWYKNNSRATTHPVGQKAPNAWDLYDMHGNVLEWVEDEWHDNYKGAPDDGRAWVDNPGGDVRVMRGGSWSNLARYCRSARRSRRSPGFPDDRIGFRLSRSLAIGTALSSKRREGSE